MKNLLDDNVKTEILARIDTLTPEAKAQWGKMNVNQGLRHMALAFDISSGILDPTPAKVPPMPKWLLKFFLTSMKPPKAGAETFKEMNMVETHVNPVEFEAERRNLKEAVQKFTRASTFLPVNKLAGKFSKDDWGKVNYNHTDHHLRQFGA
jgi:Protein of unknown function (DUF1569)